ncbi:tetratricopeptide repeat protein [Moorena producens]|uniref:tetratricopeptide repeat protein n=1 Tax=Moorena producens TaxID=1155739 RepID=UPI003C72FF20
MTTNQLLESNLESLINTAAQKHQLGKLDEAESIYRQVIQIQGDNQGEEKLLPWPYNVIAIANLASIFEEKNKLEEAVGLYQQALTLKPDFAEVHNNLGNIFWAKGELEKAVQYYQEAIRVKPDYALAHNNLGNLFHNQGKLGEAVDCYQEAIRVKPDYAQAYCNLGNVLQVQGKLDAARESYQEAIKLKADCFQAHNNLGTLFQKQGKLDAARESYQEAIRLKPDYADAHNNLGTILQKQGKLEEAIQSYQEAIRLKPDFAEVYNNLGNTLHEQCKLEEALQSYQQALSINPNLAEAKLAMCVCQIPIIYSSVDEIKVTRNNYQASLKKLADSYTQSDTELSPRELLSAAKAVGAFQPFYLAYQGLNNRELQQIYGAMICQIMWKCYPRWSQKIPLPNLAPHEKVRIGLISEFFWDHSNWKIPIKGWVENIDRSNFELFGYHTGLKQDKETAIAAKSFVKFVHGSLTIEEWCEVITEDKLHILIFPEFGMSPTTVKLGCLRLAPIQMTSWGHPDTSGMPTIDYYLSSDLMEAENAQDHYSETLVRLPNLSIHYTPLEITPEAIAKKDIGLDDDDIMFWCCQSLYKYLPDYDDVFPRIAKELDCRCKFVFIKYVKSDQVTEIFEQRLRDAFNKFDLDYTDYCIFLPFLNNRRFAGTSAIADVFLDSIGWSGCNSSLESIAHNIPIVTLPGDLMRGRHTMAILKMMGLEETIASSKEDYVKIAVRLGQDAQYRQYISNQVAENKHKLYGDLKPVRALEDFLLNVVHKPRQFAMETVSEALQLAVQHRQGNRLNKAVQVYYKILEQQPNHPEALYGLGVLAQQTGQYDTAEKLFRATVEAEPNSVKGWFSLGNLCQGQGQLSDSVEYYQRVLTIQPNLIAVHNNLGYALQQQGNWDDAIASYQQALEIDPTCTEADVNLGNALHAQGKLSQEKQAHYAELNYELGVTRQKAGDLTNAVAYYRQAVAMQSDLVSAHYNLGVVLQDQGEFENAIASYQKVLELNPSYGEVYFNLGRIYQTQKQLKEAASAYRQGLMLVNPRYGKVVNPHNGSDNGSDNGSTLSPETLTPPQVEQPDVTIGGYQFPGIPSVSVNEDKRPFWTVIIPLYNRTDYLLECLASVLAQWQGEEEMEILVMDNASTPPLYDLVNSIGGGVVRYYRNPENIGARRNFNLGIALSRGQWIHVLPEDEYVLPGFYSRLKKSLETCSDSVGAAFTGYENINEKGKIIFSQQVYGKDTGIHQDWLWKIGTSNVLNPCAVVIRRSTHEHLGCYDPGNTYTPDWELYKRIASFYDWWYEGDILARYREHDNNMTSELILSGAQATSIRLGIEISESYLPAEHCAAITANARNHYFNYCLNHMVIPLKTGNLAGAFRLLQEALKIDPSPQAVEKLFTWLTQAEAAPLRDEIASKLRSIMLNHSSESFYFAYP